MQEAKSNVCAIKPLFAHAEGNGCFGWKLCRPDSTSSLAECLPNKGLKSPLHSDLNQVSNWNRFVGVMEENWKNHLIAWVSFFRRRTKMTRNRFALVSASAIVALMSLGLSIPIIQASGNTLKLAPTSGSLTPSASGELSFSLSRGVLSGKAETEDLPPLGSHLAYVLWFVNTATNDKAFLGPLICGVLGETRTPAFIGLVGLAAVAVGAHLLWRETR